MLPDPISPRSDVNVRGLEEACTFLLSTSDQIQKRTPLEAGEHCPSFRVFQKDGETKNVEHPEDLEVFLGGGSKRRTFFSAQKSGKALFQMDIQQQMYCCFNVEFLCFEFATILGSPG